MISVQCVAKTKMQLKRKWRKKFLRKNCGTARLVYQPRKFYMPYQQISSLV